MIHKNRGISLLANILAAVCSLIVAVPALVLLINSCKTASEANAMSLSLPTVWQFSNFFTVITQGKLISSFFNSLLYAGSAVIIITAAVSAAAFVISRRKKGLNAFFYYFIIAGIAMPVNNAALMRVLQLFGLVNTRTGIILLYAAMNIPLSLFLCYGFIATIPRELDEAALLDACTPAMLFIRIIAPLLKPIVSTLCVLNFMAVWNDFAMPLYYLNSSRKWPMTLAVYNFFGAYENSWNLVCADIVLTLLPVLIVFIAGQRYITGGIAAGAVKG